MTTAPQSIQKPAAAPSRMQTIKQLIESRQDAFSQLLPKHLSADRLMKVALNCIYKTPKLQDCTPASLLQSVIGAAELGLEPGGALGEAYLVPYGNTCQLIIGYRGFIRLARQSGDLAQIEAHVVHERDDFKLEFGLNPVMRHIPFLDGPAGAPKLAYMLARLKDGSVHMEVMTIAEVEAVRARSKGARSGPWVTDYEEMVKKTVVRRGMKFLPLSSERVDKAVEKDNDDFVDGQFVSAAGEIAADVAGAKPSKVERAKAALRPVNDAHVIDAPMPDAVPMPSDADAPPQVDDATPF